jgi:hypothetical protein
VKELCVKELRARVDEGACKKVVRESAACGRDVCEGIVFCVQKLSVEESCVKDMYVEEVFVKGLCAEEIYAEELHANERCTRVLCATCGRGAPRPVTETDGLQQMSGCLHQSNHLGRTSS